MRTPSYLLFLFGTLAISGIIGIFTYFAYRTLPKPQSPEPNSAPAAAALSAPSRPTVRATDPIRGNPSAPVAIVEFGDFFCDACAQVDPTLKKLLAEYQGRVKLVWKDLPNVSRHPLSQKAAEAARCADEQGRFWEYHDGLFASQGQFLTEESMLLIAQNLNLDTAQFSDCLSSGRTAALVERSLNEGILLRVDATPYFFIGEKRFSGAIDETELKNAIETAL